MLKSMHTPVERCPKCQARLFLSRDPLDEPGTRYCIAGHTFVPQNRPANRIGVAVGLPSAA